MQYNFTTSSNRTNTNAEKYIKREQLFNTTNIEPLWIADMDLDSPPCVQEAILKRLNQPTYGYEVISNDTFSAQINWLNNHYNTSYKLEDILYSISVVSSMNATIEAFSQENDEILMATPVYAPFFNNTKELNRIPVCSSLKKDNDGIYRFDFDDLKSKITKKTKIFLLCNPHNPVGRAWKKDELEQLLDICKQNNIIVFSDEIHCDLVYTPNKHIPFSTLPSAKDITVTAYSMGKSFNLGGLGMSTVMIQDNNLRDKFNTIFNKFAFKQGNIFSMVAFKEAYTNAKPWLDEAKIHLYENYNKLKNVIDKYPNIIKITPIEATYLAWLDCTQMNLDDTQLKQFFIKEAKLGLGSGIGFGEEGSKFMRLNFAVSSTKMDQILSLLDNALKKRYA